MERSISRVIRILYSVIQRYTVDVFNPQKMVNYTQYQVVRYLFKHDGEDVCQKDLEVETGLRKASMTGCLDTMEDKGLIVREQANDDKRKKYIRMTDLLKKYGIDVIDRSVQLDHMLLNGIDKQDMEIFYKVFDQIMENVREADI